MNPKAYSVRIPAELRNELEKKAKNNSRSLHAEILLGLENHIINTPEKQLLSEIDIDNPKLFDLIKKAVRVVAKEDNE